MIYKIQKKLEEIYGSKSALAKELKISPEVVYRTFKKQNARFATMQKYTKAFNKLFKTDYGFRDLFELVEEKGKEKNVK